MKCSAALALLLPLAAMATPRAEYAQQWPLRLAREGAGAYRVTLEESVYRQLRDPVLRDAVVIDGDGVAVPTDVFAPEAPLAKTVQRFAVPWFPLPAAPAGGTQAWQLVSQADADGRLQRVEVRTSDANAATLPRNALLLDLSRMQGAVSAIELQWQPLESLDLGYRVEASDDLEHWQLLGARGRMVDLQRGGRRLVQRRIELGGQLPSEVRYVRLTPDRNDVAVAISGVFAESTASRTSAPEWIELSGRGVDALGVGRERGAAFEFDTESRFPVQQVDVALPGDHAVEWILESRDSADADWQRRAGPWLAFRVGSARDGHADSQSPARDLGPIVRDRHWRLRTTTPIAGVPMLRLGYRPEVVVFVAQGKEPYALAAGSMQAHRAASPLPQLVAEMRRQRGPEWQPAQAVLGAPRMLAGDAALAPARDWKTWLLWAVLGLGAAVIAGFAITLLRARPVAAQSGISGSNGDTQSD